MAARKQHASRKVRNPALDATPRHLWLASLGILAVARRESGAVVARATRRVEDAVEDARYAIRRAGAEMRAGVDGVRGQVEPRVQKLGSDVEARLAPIVAKLGLGGSRGPRSRAAAKPRRTRKPAKRAPRKAAR